MNRAILIIVVLLLFFSAFCSSPKKITGPDAGGGKLVILEINPRDLTVRGQRVTYRPNRRVKRAVYFSYEFDRREFVDKIDNPKNLTKPVKIEVFVIQTWSRKHNPHNPMLQAPQGGFRYYNYTCRIVKVIEK